MASFGAPPAGFGVPPAAPIGFGAPAVATQPAGFFTAQPNAARGISGDAMVPAASLPQDSCSSLALLDVQGTGRTILAAGSWDSTVRLWSVSGTLQTLAWGGEPYLEMGCGSLYVLVVVVVVVVVAAMVGSVWNSCCRSALTPDVVYCSCSRCRRRTSLPKPPALMRQDGQSCAWGFDRGTAQYYSGGSTAPSRRCLPTCRRRKRK